MTHRVHTRSLMLMTSICWVLFAMPVAADEPTGDAFNKNFSTAVRTGYELYGGYVTDLAVDTNGHMYAATLSANGIFHSTDTAATWSGPAADSDLGKVNAIALSDQADTAYIIGGISLYKTTDGGTSWTELVGSTGSTSTNDYSTALAYANGILIAPQRNGVVDISTDEGVSFSGATLTGADDVAGIAGNSTGSAFYLLASLSTDLANRTLYSLDPTTGNFTSTNQTGNYAWVKVKPSDDNVIVIAGADGALYTTTGANGTWQTLDSDPVTGEINFVGERIYLGDRYSDNNGASWTTLATHANQLAVDQNNPQTILIGSSTGVDISSDGGGAWSSSSNGILGVTVNDIAQSSKKTSVWLAAQGGLAHSSNFLSDAPTWDYPILPDQASTDMSTVWVDPDDKQHVVAGGSSLFYTTDDGDLWQVATGIDLTPGTYGDIVANGNTLYAAFAAQTGTDGTVYFSTDGGASWTDMGGLDVPVNALGALDNGNLIAGVGYEFNSNTSQRGIFMYDGSHWTQINAATDQALTSVLVVGEVIYVAGIGSPDGKVIRSSDNGASWTDVTGNGLPSAAYFQSLASQSGTDTVYAATGRPAGTGYLYKSTDSGDNWSLLYTGLVDEEFNAMLFDGLTTGTTVGLQTLYSKATLNLKADKKTIKNDQGVKLTVHLKDKTTSTALNQRTVQLYSKSKKQGAWKLVHLSTPLKTNKQGVVSVQRQPTHTTYYQIRWTPNTSDSTTYSTSETRSVSLKVEVK